MSTAVNPAAISLQYERQNLTSSRVPVIIASVAICFPLACIAVILRFVCRRVNDIRIKVDDWTILIALVSKTTQL